MYQTRRECTYKIVTNHNQQFDKEENARKSQSDARMYAHQHARRPHERTATATATAKETIVRSGANGLASGCNGTSKQV